MKYILIILSGLLLMSSCLKKKNEEPSANGPLSPVNNSEIITTMKIIIRDSVTGNEINGSPFVFKDGDGDGGNAGVYLPTNADSLITLNATTTYLAEILLLDETKDPVDTISNEVIEEGQDHMFFFEQSNPVGNPYSVILPGSGVTITYLDLDENNRGIGQRIKLRSGASTGGLQFPFTVTLRHQPGEKDGTFAPGETDVETRFKIKVN